MCAECTEAKLELSWKLPHCLLPFIVLEVAVQVTGLVRDEWFYPSVNPKVYKSNLLDKTLHTNNTFNFYKNKS